MINSTLIKKLKQYSALAAPAMVMTGIAHAQVIYTDVNPDKEITATPGTPQGDLIDMGNDGSFDFTLAVFTSFDLGNGNKVNLVGAGLYSNNGDGMMGYTNVIGTKKFYYPLALDPGAPINADQHFRNSFGAYGTMVWFYPNNGLALGQWNDVTDKYLGVRFKDTNGANHYGWVRMDVFKNPAKIVLKDYAYQSAADQSINAGDGFLTSVAPVNPADKLVVYAYERNVFIQSSMDNNQPLIITVTDMAGKTILNETSNQNSLTLSLKNVSDGLCIVNVIKGDEEKTRKVFLR